jgi:hypothetical protein
MSEDPYRKVTEEKGLLGTIQKYARTYIGYYDRETRRDADKILRETITSRYEEQWSRISEIQRQLIADKQLEYVDDLEAGSVKLRGLIDRIGTAAYGYAGFFDVVRVNQDELNSLYEYDLLLLENADKISRAIDHVQASVGTDGIEPAIRNMVAVIQESTEAYNRREEVILST